jgi:hypothetical protein
MADNYTATAGSGLTFGAKDVDDVLYTRVQLDFGDAGEVFDVGASNPLPVVGYESSVVITIIPTLDTGAYSDGDLLLDCTELADVVRNNGGTAILQSITVIDRDLQNESIKLFFCDAAVDFGTVNSAPSPDDAASASVLGVITLDSDDYVALSDFSVLSLSNLGLALKTDAADTSLYVAAQVSSTPTYTANGMTFRFGFIRS